MVSFWQKGDPQSGTPGQLYPLAGKVYDAHFINGIPNTLGLPLTENAVDYAINYLCVELPNECAPGWVRYRGKPPY